MKKKISIYIEFREKNTKNFPVLKNQVQLSTNEGQIAQLALNTSDYKIFSLITKQHYAQLCSQTDFATLLATLLSGGARTASL